MIDERCAECGMLYSDHDPDDFVPALPPADHEKQYATLRQAVRDFFAHAMVYGDDGQFQVTTSWHPDAMGAARRMYDLAQPDLGEIVAILGKKATD